MKNESFSSQMKCHKCGGMNIMGNWNFIDGEWYCPHCSFEIGIDSKDKTIEQLQSELAEANEQIENLKCCANCKWSKDITTAWYCRREEFAFKEENVVDADCVCKYWASDESTKKDREIK